MIHNLTFKIYILDFLTTHLIYPSIIFISLISLIFSIEYFNLDYLLGNLFYDANNKMWPLRDYWLTKTVLHDWGQKLSISMGIITFLSLIASLVYKKWQSYTRLLFYLFIASVSGPILIAILKNFTHIYCPYNLTIFGGDKPYIRLFDPVNINLPIGHCFPGGHSSGGYAFISLYFYMYILNQKYKFHGLSIGIFIGTIFGLTQELRGAHFLSHDICSLFICWFLSAILFVIIFHKQFEMNFINTLRNINCKDHE